MMEIPVFVSLCILSYLGDCIVTKDVIIVMERNQREPLLSSLVCSSSHQH